MGKDNNKLKFVHQRFYMRSYSCIPIVFSSPFLEGYIMNKLGFDPEEHKILFCLISGILVFILGDCLFKYTAKFFYRDGEITVDGDNIVLKTTKTFEFKRSNLVEVVQKEFYYFGVNMLIVYLRYKDGNNEKEVKFFSRDYFDDDKCPDDVQAVYDLLKTESETKFD